MPAKRKKQIFVLSVLGILFSAALLCFFVILVNVSKIQSDETDDSVPLAQRDYSVLITGVPGTESFLKQVYEGASIVSNFYDCAIQYYIPEIRTKDNSLQSLFDYAGFINADCVITYLDAGQDDFELPVNTSGELIPLITVGVYSSEIPQLSHIGINYAELGIKMAREAIDFLDGNGSVFILNISDFDNFYNSTLVNNLYNSLRLEKGITVLNSALTETYGLSIEDTIRQHIASSGKIDLILALSEQSTVLAAQTVLDLNLSSVTKIIGFGEGRESSGYYQKGIVSELFCSDAVDIGKKSIQQFSEYKTNGSANSYVSANIKILKPGKK
ncbi:MAG: hypothetical protein ACI4LX_08995 [Treponema sp.]